MDFENKSGASPGSTWNFLKREKGPYSSDPFANGLGEQSVIVSVRSLPKRGTLRKKLSKQPLQKRSPGLGKTY